MVTILPPTRDRLSSFWSAARANDAMRERNGSQAVTTHYEPLFVPMYQSRNRRVIVRRRAA